MVNGEYNPADYKTYIIEDLWPYVRDIDSVHINPTNSLTHSEKSIEAAAESLREFGQREPIFINKNSDQITSGNRRWLAASGLLGWKHIAVIGEKDDIETAARWGIAANVVGPRQSEFNWENIRQIRESLPDQTMAWADEDFLTNVDNVVEGDEIDGDAEDVSEQFIPERYIVIVECSDEPSQEKALGDLMGQGYQCKAVTA